MRLPNHIRRATRALALVALAMMPLAMGCSRSWFAPSTSYRGSPSYGIVTQTWSPEIARWTSELGTGWVRLDVNWFEVEPQRGVFSWATLDTRVSSAQAEGLRVYATVAYTPAWAGPCQHCMPTDVADWRTFVQALMEHYRGTGLVYGIWNEPNLGFLDDTPDGERYAQLYGAAHAARLAVDRTAVLAGPETSHHAFPDYYLAVMQRIQPSQRASDIVSVHYYPDARLDLRSYMQSVGDGAQGHRVWLTETGIGTCDDTAQQQFLSSALGTFTGEGRVWWPTLFVYVLFNGQRCGDTLINPDGAQRQGYLTYRDFITAHP